LALSAVALSLYSQNPNPFSLPVSRSVTSLIQFREFREGSGRGGKTNKREVGFILPLL